MFLTPISITEVDKWPRFHWGVSNMHGCALEERAFNSFPKYYPCCIYHLGSVSSFFHYLQKKKLEWFWTIRQLGQLQFCMYTKACKRIVTAAFLITAQNRRPSKCLSVGEWADKTLHIHTIEYCLAVKMSKLLMPGTTWVNLQNILLSERSQTQKTTYRGIPWLCSARSRQVHGHRCKQARARSGREAEGQRHQRTLGDGDMLSRSVRAVTQLYQFTKVTELSFAMSKYWYIVTPQWRYFEEYFCVYESVYTPRRPHVRSRTHVHACTQCLSQNSHLEDVGHICHHVFEMFIIVIKPPVSQRHRGTCSARPLQTGRDQCTRKARLLQSPEQDSESVMQWF